MVFTVLRTDRRTPGPGILTPITESEAFEPCFRCFIEHDYPFKQPAFDDSLEGTSASPPGSDSCVPPHIAAHAESFAGGDGFPVKTRSRRKPVRTAAPTPARARLAVAGEVVTRGRRARGSFAKIPEILDVPDRIAVQRRSYERCLRERIREGFEEVSPIQDFNGNLELHFAVDPSRKGVDPPSAFDDTPVLDFGGYRLERFKNSEEECADPDYHFSAAL